MKYNRDKEIEEYLNEPVKPGDKVTVRGLGRQDKKSWGSTASVIKIGENNSVFIEEYKSLKEIQAEDWKKWTGHIGKNPFNTKRDSIRNINFQLSSIIHQLSLVERWKDKPYISNGVEISDCNWNPYVYDKEGNKLYYQRDFVWTLKDKQLLIDSIYNNIDCGKILIRKRSFAEIDEMTTNGEKNVALQEVVDGKQRLDAIRGFLNNEYKDSFGNYYKDLSENAKWRFTEHQLFSYSELPENTKDEEVLEQFLKLSICGRPQDPKHISKVAEYLKMVK